MSIIVVYLPVVIVLEHEFNSMLVFVSALYNAYSIKKKQFNINKPSSLLWQFGQHLYLSSRFVFGSAIFKSTAIFKSLASQITMRLFAYSS